MRDHFDPLAPLLHQNQHHTDPHHGSHMQGQIHHHQPSKIVRPPQHNPFGNGFSNAGGFSAVATTGNIHDSVREKRNNVDENVDCNLLQSSLKRVRLSRSPGEFRLQRDLKTLDAMQWGSSHVAANGLNFSSTTWIHRSTGARLTLVDTLRICLFLPTTATQQNGQLSINVNTEQQYQYQLHSYHRDYRWRIMIQIPRMYPHSPPVVTRIEGLTVESIAINEMPPDGQHHPNASRSGKRNNESDGASSVHSTSGVATSESLFFTEAQLARSSSSITMASNETQNTNNGGGKAIEWNQWSPITGLGELLDFLLQAASSNPSTTTMNEEMQANTSALLGKTKNAFEQSMAVTTARMSSSSSSSLSSVSSASSISSWGKRNSVNHDSSRAASSLQRGGNNTVTETMMSDEHVTTGSVKTSLSGASFLSPNRFDVGYGKSVAGHRFAGTTGMVSRTTAASSWQQHSQYRGRQGDEDVGMDMS